MLVTVSSEFLTLLCSMGKSCSISLSLPLVSQAGRFFSLGIPVAGLIATCGAFSAASLSSVAFLVLDAASGFRLFAIEAGLAIGLVGLSAGFKPLLLLVTLEILAEGFFRLAIAGLVAVLLLSFTRETPFSCLGEGEIFLFMPAFNSAMGLMGCLPSLSVFALLLRGML
jgi:hypothetical protein